MPHGLTIPSIHHHDVTHFGVKKHTMKQTETHTLFKYVICKILRIYIRNGI